MKGRLFVLLLINWLSAGCFVLTSFDSVPMEDANATGDADADADADADMDRIGDADENRDTDPDDSSDADFARDADTNPDVGPDADADDHTNPDADSPADADGASDADVEVDSDFTCPFNGELGAFCDTPLCEDGSSCYQLEESGSLGHFCAPECSYDDTYCPWPPAPSRPTYCVLFGPPPDALGLCLFSCSRDIDCPCDLVCHYLELHGRYCVAPP